MTPLRCFSTRSRRAANKTPPAHSWWLFFSCSSPLSVFPHSLPPPQDALTGTRGPILELLCDKLDEKLATDDKLKANPALAELKLKLTGRVTAVTRDMAIDFMTKLAKPALDKDAGLGSARDWEELSSGGQAALDAKWMQRALDLAKKLAIKVRDSPVVARHA